MLQQQPKDRKRYLFYLLLISAIGYLASGYWVFSMQLKPPAGEITMAGGVAFLIAAIVVWFKQR